MAVQRKFQKSVVVISCSIALAPAFALAENTNHLHNEWKYTHPFNDISFANKNTPPSYIKNSQPANATHHLNNTTPRDDYNPSQNISIGVDKYEKYDEYSKKLQNLEIKTPGGGNYPATAIMILYNGSDVPDFAGKTLFLNNINITAEKSPDPKFGGHSGISSRSNNIVANNIKIISNDDKYTAIDTGGNENFNNHMDDIKFLTSSNFVLNHSRLILNGDVSTGLFVHKMSVYKDSFANLEANDLDAEINGAKSTFLNVNNATATINTSRVNINGNYSRGLFVVNSGKATLNGTTIDNKGEGAVGIIIGRYYVPNYWEEEKKDWNTDKISSIEDDQQVTLDKGSHLFVKNGTAIGIADGYVDKNNAKQSGISGGTNTVNVNDNSSIISKTLIDAKAVDNEVYKKHPTKVILNVSNNSLVEGAVKTQEGATSTINLASNSTWNVTGDSNLTNLQTNDSSVNFKKDGDNFTTTHVDNLSGENGTYTFDVDIVNQKGSKLIIDTSSSGTHIAQGANNGAENTNGTESITLIEDKSGDNAKAVFNPGKDVELGGYSYQVQRDPNNPDNWILAPKSKPGPDPKPTPNDTAKTITGLASTSYLMNQAEMSTLRQRMGDLTRAGKAAQGDVSGAWGRMYGGNYKTRDNDNLAKADMNYYGFQLGGDVNTVHYSDNTNYLGIFVGHTTGKPDYYRGDATITSWYGGFYDTFIADDGFYVDSAVKLGQYRNNYNLKDSQDNGLNGKAHSSVITLSSQVGKRFLLTENDSYNVYAEPQAQLTYSRIGTFNTTASNGLRVKQKAYNSTVARLGVVLGTQINKQSDIYLKTSYLHEFSKDVNYTLNDSRESYSVKGDGLEAGLGMNVKLNDNGYLYAEGDYINSKTHYTGYKFNIGYRYSF